jgi:hypothetical protein
MLEQWFVDELPRSSRMRKRIMPAGLQQTPWASASGPVQIGDAADASEREAETVADRVTGSPALSCGANDGDRNEGGRGIDFGSVRIHTDAAADEAAQSIDARAFTHDRHVVFAAGQYAPGTRAGQHLLAHELAHVVQQGALPDHQIRRKPTGNAKPTSKSDAEEGYYERYIKIPGQVNEREFIVLSFMQIFGLSRKAALKLVDEVHAEFETAYRPPDDSEIAARQKLVAMPVGMYRRLAARASDNGGDGSDRAGGKSTNASHATASELAIHGGSKGGGTEVAFRKFLKGEKGKINEATDRSFWQRTGDEQHQKLDTKNAPKDKAQPQLGKDLPAALIAQREQIVSANRDIGDLVPDPAELNPEDFPQVLRIIQKLKALGPADVQLFRLIARELTTDLTKFEDSLDTFTRFRDQFRKQIETRAKSDGGKDAYGEPSLEEQVAETWQHFDAADFGKLNESQRVAKARDMAARQRNIRLKYMAKHPGQTAYGMVKGVVRVDQVYEGIEKDLKLAADGNASAAARVAGRLGATSKATGWIAGVAGILFVALLFVPGVNIPALAAAALDFGIAAIVLSAAAAENRIGAAGSAKTLGEFETHTEEAGAAQADAIVGVIMIATGLLLKLVARIRLPGRLQSVGNAFRLARNALLEKTGVAGKLRAIRQGLLGKLRGERAGVIEQLDQAATSMADVAKRIEGLTGDELLGQLASGDQALRDLTGITPEQAKQMQAVANTPTGKGAANQLKQTLLEAMKDAPDQARSQAQRFVNEIDQAIAEIEAAENETDLNAAIDKGQQALSSEEAARQAAAQDEAYRQAKLQAAPDQPGDAAGAAQPTPPSEPPIRQADPSPPTAADPKAKASQPQAESVEVPPATADAFETIGKKYGFSDSLIDELRKEKIDPALLEKVIEKARAVKGSKAMPADKLGDLAIEYATKALEITRELTRRGVMPKQAAEAAQLAAELGVLDATRDLAAAEGYRNPERLLKLLRGASKGKLGDLRALEDASARAKAGKEVGLETPEGDVREYPTTPGEHGEVVQHKSVTSPQERAVLQNMNDAARQLRGETGEVPVGKPTRTAHIHIESPSNPLYAAADAAVRDFITRAVQDPAYDMSGADVFRITNSKGTFDVQMAAVKR